MATVIAAKVLEYTRRYGGLSANRQKDRAGEGLRSDPALASALWTGGIDGNFVSLSSSS